MEAMLQGMGQLVCADTLEKPKGSVSCQSSLHRSQVKDPGPGPGSARAKSVKAAELLSGAHGGERGENCSSVCSGDRAATGWEALRRSYRQ